MDRRDLNLKALFAMNVLDLTKATIVCAGIAFLVYTFPFISQGLIIGLLAVIWFTYARKLIRNLVRR